MNNWKEIPNTNGLYLVNKEGQIKRIEGKVRNTKTNGLREVGGNILSPKTKRNGYKEINAYIEANKSKMIYVHRAVASAFIGEIKKGYAVNHIDGDKSNNNLSNLEIVTYSQNSKHAFDNGLNTNPSFNGQEHPMTSLTNDDVLAIRNFYSLGAFPKEISENTGMPYSTICKICYRKTWKHI